MIEGSFSSGRPKKLPQVLLEEVLARLLPQGHGIHAVIVLTTVHDLSEYIRDEHSVLKWACVHWEA